jgi:hypothetical protein
MKRRAVNSAVSEFKNEAAVDEQTLILSSQLTTILITVLYATMTTSIKWMF